VPATSRLFQKRLSRRTERADEIIWQSAPMFEPFGNGQIRLIPTKKTTAKYDDGHISEKSRGDWMPLELFVAGVRGWEVGPRQCLNDETTSPQSVF